jgi:hypothetical protein
MDRSERMQVRFQMIIARWMFFVSGSAGVFSFGLHIAHGPEWKNFLLSGLTGIFSFYIFFSPLWRKFARFYTV